MYVSITGLKPRNFISWIIFWITTLPASSLARKANGILLCEFSSRNGYQHTLTVWQTKQHMMAYRASPAHTKAMRAMSKIGSGKVFGYEATTIPSWETALSEWDENGRMV